MGSNFPAEGDPFRKNAPYCNNGHRSRHFNRLPKRREASGCLPPVRGRFENMPEQDVIQTIVSGLFDFLQMMCASPARSGRIRILRPHCMRGFVLSDAQSLRHGRMTVQRKNDPR